MEEDLPKQPTNATGKAKLAFARALRSVDFFTHRHKEKPGKQEEKEDELRRSSGPSSRPSTEIPGAQIDESVLDTIDDVEASLSELRSLSAAAKSFSVPQSKQKVAGFLVSPSLSSFTNEEEAQRTQSECAARESWHVQRKLLLQQLQEQQQQQQQEAPAQQHRHGKVARKASQTQLLPSIDTSSAASPASSQQAASTPRGRPSALKAALALQRPGTSSIQLHNDTPLSQSPRPGTSSLQLCSDTTLSHSSSTSAKNLSDLSLKTKGETPPHRSSYLQFSAEEPSILGPTSSPTAPGSLATLLTSPRSSANASLTTTANNATTPAPVPHAVPPLPFSRSSLPSVFSPNNSNSTSGASTQLQASPALKPSAPTPMFAPHACVPPPLRPHPPQTDMPPLSPRPMRELEEGPNPPTAVREGQLTTREGGLAPVPPAPRGRFMFATQASINRSEGPISKSNSQNMRSLGRSGSSMRERTLGRSSSSKKERTLSRSGSSKKERSLARSGSSKKRQGIQLRGASVRRNPSTRSLLSGKSGSGRHGLDSSEPERSAPSESATSQKSQWFSLSRGSTQLSESLNTAEATMSDSSSADNTLADLLSPHMFPEQPASPRVHRPPRHAASAHLLYQAMGNCAAAAAAGSEGSCEGGGDAHNKISSPGLFNRRPVSQLASTKSAPRKQHSTPNMKHARFNLPPAMPLVHANSQSGLPLLSPRPPDTPPPPPVAVRPSTTAPTARSTPAGTSTSSPKTPSSSASLDTKPVPTWAPAAKLTQAEPPPSSSGKLAKQAGSLKQFLAGQRLDVNRLEPDTYLLMLDVESRGRAQTLGRFAGQSRPRSKSSYGCDSAPSLSRASMPSLAADGLDGDPVEDVDVKGDGGECKGWKAGSLPGQGKAGNSLSSMLSQLEDEEKELQMLHERARLKSREGMNAELRPQWRGH